MSKKYYTEKWIENKYLPTKATYWYSYKQEGCPSQKQKIWKSDWGMVVGKSVNYFFQQKKKQTEKQTVNIFFKNPTTVETQNKIYH